jgi:hypothetical protein
MRRSQISVAEEQPQQNNHRNRHAEQPEQKSSSHYRLLEFLIDSRTRKAKSGSAMAKEKPAMSGVGGASDFWMDQDGMGFWSNQRGSRTRSVADIARLI